MEARGGFYLKFSTSQCDPVISAVGKLEPATSAKTFQSHPRHQGGRQGLQPWMRMRTSGVALPISAISCNETGEIISVNQAAAAGGWGVLQTTTLPNNLLCMRL